VSNNKSLKTIYQEVYDELEKSCQDVLDPRRERARLSAIVFAILGKSTLQIDVQEIFNAVGIKDSDFSDDDDKIVEELSQIFKSQVSPKRNPRAYMEFLVFTACALVGVSACLKYLKSKKEPDKMGQSISDLHPLASETKFSPAELCLVVPASEVSSFSHGSCLNGMQLKKLVNSASYFLCTTSREILKIEKDLPLTDEAIPVDSPRGVYVRFTVESGNNMIDKTTRYEIKENIKDSEKYQIIKLKWLGGFSGLESFIRI